MNAFADWLFSVLLGWTGNIANEAWSTINNDQAGFTSFLAKIWLPLLIVLVLAGTAADFIVWFIRWRPHYVWRSKGLARKQQKQMATAYQSMEHGEMSPEYRDQIAQWVTSDEEPPLPGLWDDVPQVQYTPAYQQQPVYEMPPQNNDTDMNSLPPDDVYHNQYMRPDGQNALDPYMPPPEYAEDVSPAYMEPLADAQLYETPYIQEEAPLISPEMQSYYDSYVPEAIEPAEDNAMPSSAPRKRRSRGRQKNSSGGILGHLLKQIPRDLGDEDVRAFPPPVNPENTFRSPVYPESYQYRDAAIHPPQAQDDGSYNGQS